MSGQSWLSVVQWGTPEPPRRAAYAVGAAIEGAGRRALTLPQICAASGVTQIEARMVCAALCRAGALQQRLNGKRQVTYARPRPPYSALAERAVLHLRQCAEPRSAAEIARALGCTPRAVTRALLAAWCEGALLRTDADCGAAPTRYHAEPLTQAQERAVRRAQEREGRRASLQGAATMRARGLETLRAKLARTEQGLAWMRAQLSDLEDT